MVSFIEFPIFDGVSGDLRPWISWLEDFFVRERFTADEKMNLAQSLLEGEAEVWFYRNQKILLFQSWEDLKDSLLLRFGDFADSDRIRLIAEHDRFLKEIRDEARIQRMKTTSIPEKDSIWETETEALVPTDTFPVTNLTESRETIDSTLATKSIPEAISESVMDGGVSFEKEISCQAIEYIHAIKSFSAKESIEKDESHEAKMVKVESETAMFQSLAGISFAYQVFDKTSPHKERLKSKMKRKLSLSPKTWMFKFKNKNLQRQYSCSRANFGYKWKEHNSRHWRRMRQTHMSRLLCNLRVRQDPRGLGKLILDDLKSHMSAKLQIFSKHKLHNQLFALVADNVHTLPRKPATSSSMLPLYVYQVGVSDIQDNDKEMVADPVTQAVRNLVTNAARFGFITVLSQTHAVHLDVHLELSETSASTSLYGYCLPSTRSWPYHRKILIREIVGYGADVVCLQDVQIGHFEDFLTPELKKHGYECCYMKRNKKTYEVDYNKSTQALIDASNNKPFASERLIKDNIVLIAVLEAKFGDPSGKLICVANTRFDVQTDLKDVMLWQVHTLLNGLEVIAKSCKHLVPIIMCGDFNRVPGSAPHSLVVKGFTDPSHEDLKVDPLGILKPLKLKHPLPLASAYECIRGVLNVGTCFLGSLWEKKNVSWLGVVCVLAECMMHKVTVNSAKLPETLRGRELVTESGLQAVLDQIIRRNNVWEAYTKIIGKLQIKLKQGMDLHGASWHCSSYEMNQFHSPIGLVDVLHSGLRENVHTLPAAEQKSSSIWHRWRRKD